LGLTPSINILYAILFILPISLLFIALGLLFGSILNDKQVGGICGALLTNLSAWLSGIWFDLELVGGTFQKIANLLPFVHAVELERHILAGSFSQILPHLGWVLGYGIVCLALAILLFLRQMKKQSMLWKNLVHLSYVMKDAAVSLLFVVQLMKIQAVIQSFVLLKNT
jgi:ABC-2 type transport system permease protein